MESPPPNPIEEKIYQLADEIESWDFWHGFISVILATLAGFLAVLLVDFQAPQTRTSIFSFFLVVSFTLFYRLLRPRFRRARKESELRLKDLVYKNIEGARKAMARDPRAFRRVRKFFPLTTF